MPQDGKLNFLPEDYLEKRRQQRTNVICLSLFGVVMAGLIGAFMLDERRQAAAAQDRDAINRRMDDAGRQLAQIEQMQANKEKMIRKADVTASLLERRPRHFLIALLTNALPKGSSLLTIDLATKEIKRKEVKAEPADAKSGARVSRVARPEKDDKSAKEEMVRVETIRLIGLAPDDKVVSRFIAALDTSPLFRRIDLESSEEHVYNEQKVRRFILRIELDDQAEVTDDMVQSQKLRPDAFE